MSALEAARLGDEIGHTSAMKGLLAGLVVGFVVTGLVLLAAGATVATGGAAAVVIGALIAGTAGGGLAGMKIGALFESDPKGPIATGSPNTFLGTGKKPAARAKLDIVRCEDHSEKRIAQGSLNVFINKAPAARRTDKTVCSGPIRDGQPDVFFGGPTGTYLEMESEVPGWLVTTLEYAALAGAVIATGGAILTVGFGAAMIGLGGSLLGGWAGSEIGGAIGGLFGEKGRAIGEAIGGFGGSILGGMGAGKLYEGAVEVPRTAEELAAARPVEDPLPVKPIDEVQARLTPEEQATYQESMRIAREEPIEVGPKTFYSGRGASDAADVFVADNPEYVRLENGTQAGKMLDANSKGLASALDRSTGDQRLPWQPPDGVSSEGYGVEPWKAVSGRYGQAAEGNAQAFVENSAQQSVFRNAELPELLRNPNVDKVTFRNNDGSVAGEWSRTGPNGTWEGDPVPNSNGAFDLGDVRYSGGASTPITKPATPALPTPIFSPSDDRHP